MYKSAFRAQIYTTLEAWKSTYLEQNYKYFCLRIRISLSVQQKVTKIYDSVVEHLPSMLKAPGM